MTGLIAASRLSTWRIVNISPAERLGRIAVGLAAATAGVVLLLSAASVLAIGLEVLLVLAGLDTFVTGVTGHCWLYQKLGRAPIRSGGLR